MFGKNGEIEMPKKESVNINQNQSNEKIETIDRYISEQPIEIQLILQKIRELIKTVAPNSIEKISWRMPTFWQGENLIHFAAFKNHIGIYPGDLTLNPFKDRLANYRHSKGAIQFPYTQPIDFELIADITRWRLETVENKSDKKAYEFDVVIHKTAEQDAAYIIFPYDIKTEFGKGRVKVHATFDGEPYDGSIVNMGIKNDDGSICYIIGIRKDIRKKISKQHGDTVHIIITERK